MKKYRKLNEYSILMRLLVVAKRLCWNILDYIILPAKTKFLEKLWHMHCGDDVVFKGNTIIRTYQRNSIEIGNNVVFNSCKNENLVGLSGPTILCAARGGRIEIGEYSGLSSVVINARKLIKIGRHVKIGGNVRIYDHDFHPLEWQARRSPEQVEKTRVKPVVIGDDVFIGTNAIILKGTNIGARSVVAAGCVVFGLDIPPDSIVKGNPAKVISRGEKD